MPQKIFKQCLLAKNKANLILGLINGGVSHKSTEVIKACLISFRVLYPFWSPINVKDADMLEDVQRKATKMSPGLRNLSYEERLKRLGMFSLRCKRLKSDMIEVFKMIHGIDKVYREKFFLYR